MHVSGRIIDRRTRGGVPDVRVELWDVAYDTPLASMESDPGGGFQIYFDEQRVAYEYVRRPGFGPEPGYPYRPDLFFKLFQGPRLLKSTEETVRFSSNAGEISLVVDVGSANGAADSTEVALHELGESVAATVTSVQKELDRHPSPLGTYLLEDVDLNIPLLMRVDSLGQVRASVVVSDAPPASIGQMRMRLRPAVGVPPPPPPALVDEPLGTLGDVLSAQAIAKLEQERIFSVNDLMRVASTASGRTALEKLGLGAELNAVFDRAAVLALPVVTAPVAEALFEMGVEKPADLVGVDPAQLAAILSTKLEQTVTLEDVKVWQDGARVVSSVPLPTRDLSSFYTRPVPVVPTPAPVEPDPSPAPEPVPQEPPVVDETKPEPGETPPIIVRPEPTIEEALVERLDPAVEEELVVERDRVVEEEGLVEKLEPERILIDDESTVKLEPEPILVERIRIGATEGEAPPATRRAAKRRTRRKKEDRDEG